MSETVTGSPTQITITAEVNAPEKVQLWDDDNMPFEVPAEDVTAWLRKGFKRERFDVIAKRTELEFLCDAAKVAIGAFVDNVTANGVLDTAAGKELDTAVVAVRNLHDGWQQLLYTIGQKYGVKQAPEESQP